MKSKKQKVLQSGNSKRKVSSDVSPSTSLPPLVEGPLRCFLRVTISRLLWTVNKPPSVTFVRLRWWGESSNETHFFPKDGSQLSQRNVKTTVRYAIRCGPKQFTSYLTDMSSLVLDVLTKADHLPVARAQVAGISRLSLSHPISGFFTLVSPTSEKLGELQVSLNLEPLAETYDSSSDYTVTAEGPEAATATLPLQPRSLSASSGKRLVKSSSKNPPRPQQDGGKEELAENQMPVNSCEISERAANALSQDSGGNKTNDILSLISERGNKLRDAMVRSALKYDIHSASAPNDAPLLSGTIHPPLRTVPSPSGMFLDSQSFPEHSIDVPDVFDGADDVTHKAIDILFGRLITSPPPQLDRDSVSPDCIFGHSSVCGDSETDDPQYDQSLLENLFYKSPISDTRPEVTETSGKKTLPPLKKQPKRMNEGTDFQHQDPPDAVALCGLSEEQLALLNFIRVVIVTIDTLTLSTTSATRTNLSKGKPLRQMTNQKCTYFVEYMLPRTSTSSQHVYGKSNNGDVARVASSKVTGGEVNFLQHSVFPVDFSTESVIKWCQTDLVFKIFSRKSHQKKPVLIGKAVHPLRDLLQDKQLSQALVLPVQSLEANCETLAIGPLRVCLELATDSKVSTPIKDKSQLAHRYKSSLPTAPSPPRKTGSRPHFAQTSKEHFPSHPEKDSQINDWSLHQPLKESFFHPSLNTFENKPCQHVDDNLEVLLHTLLMVPEGKNFTCGPLQTPNVYLNCKLFWCDEMTRSNVSWGQKNPTFNFVQVTPVALTSKLLERMKNNMIIIEVWQKTGSSEDRLLGLVKLPLHQFYMSFRDPKVTHLLLEAQYPVLGVDCYMPVIDVFSGACKGNLRVILAMGKSEQITALQCIKDEEYGTLFPLVKPVLPSDHHPRPETKAVAAFNEPMMEHVFVIRVEKVKGLTPLQSTVWGEADCYVQYSFPSHDDETATAVDQMVTESNVSLKPFRTTTTLCVPDPIFSHMETHVLLAPEGFPVQRLLLSSLSSRGASSGGGVQFEVWCRYYYPNVRDQLVAKGLLPLSKLCAMITMQKHQPNNPQMFSLPLIPRTDSPTGHHIQPSGLLDVCIQYKHRPVRPEALTGRGAASRVVTLVVKVRRASGLRAAASFLSKQDERFQYFVDAGVNAYATVQLSFSPERESRSTRIVAKTFCPEFDHHTELSCDLLVQMSSGETCSLAEVLERASAAFTLWNRDNRKGVIFNSQKDVMLGSVQIPLADLINKRTGISGWFGVYLPKDKSSTQDSQILVGGLEISVNFAHHSDREKVIKAAQGLGWMMQSDCETKDVEDSFEENTRTLTLTFSTPRAWVPLHCLLLPNQIDLQRSTYCYVRYKFYDQEAFTSQMVHPLVTEGADGQTTVDFKGNRTARMRMTQPLLWYLREERLEVQLWVSFNKDKTRRPTDTDRLVGSAFVDMSSLAKMSNQKLSLSGVYPLFRSSAADLQGAALRIHITLTASAAPEEAPDESDSQVELLSEEMETAALIASPTTPKKSTQSRKENKSPQIMSDILSIPHTESSVEDSFSVFVTVDRAMHLNLKSCPLAEQSEVTPSCCVSYVTADSAEPVFTPVVTHNDCPVWDHQQECRLSNQLLVNSQQSLVFKVWHKGEVDRVLGFASVDLSPLLCGFHSVYGWYNITDFSGQCHGQIKVSITPLNVIDLQVGRKTVIEEDPENSRALFQAFPLSCHTRATYSSFPSHRGCCTQQTMSSPEHTEQLYCERSIEAESHAEHLDKVRLYHQSLQEQRPPHPDCVRGTGDSNLFSSFLLSTLRRNQSELDNMQKYFNRKLRTPTFSSVCEQYYHNQQEEEEEEETDADLQGLPLNKIPTNPPRSSKASPCKDTDSQTVPQRLFSLDQNAASSYKDASQMRSPLLKTSEDDTDSEVEEETGRRRSETVMSEDEIGENTDENEDSSACEQHEGTDVEEEEEEDYEETVLKPRHLNELMSLTDKTSPWTSVQSESDVDFIENLEATEEPDLSHDEEEDKEEERQNLDSVEKHHRPVRDTSQMEGDDERHVRREVCSLHQDSAPNEDSSADLDHNIDTADDKENSQSSVPVDMPNFFLTTHEMEASLRAIQLAPSFSRGYCPTRPRLQRPNMSPLSMEKATERITGVFAATCDETL